MASSQLLWGLSMAGTATSIVQNMSGLPLMRRVVEDRDASRFTIAPLLTMTVTCLQIGLYGVFVYGLPDGLQLLACNVVGASFWALTFAVMLAFTPPPKRPALAAAYALTLAYALALPLALFTVPSSLSFEAKRNILAASGNAFNVAGFLSPVATILEAMREGSTRRVPRALSYINLVNSTLWCAYGAVLGDAWIWGPNTAGLVIAAAQVAALLSIEGYLGPSPTPSSQEEGLKAASPPSAAVSQLEHSLYVPKEAVVGDMDEAGRRDLGISSGAETASRGARNFSALSKDDKEDERNVPADDTNIAPATHGSP